MLKVYGIHGRTSALIRIPAGNSGKAFLLCEFSRGRMGAGPANRPATYATNDPVKQAIIENSSLYGSTIKLIRFYKEDGDDDVKPKRTAPVKQGRKQPVEPKKEDTPDVKLEEIEDVKTVEEAVAFLKGKGLKAGELLPDNIKKSAESIGVFFPNLNL